MAARRRAFLAWHYESDQEPRESPKAPQTPDREVVKLYDAHGREIEMQRRIGFNPKRR